MTRTLAVLLALTWLLAACRAAHTGAQEKGMIGKDRTEAFEQLTFSPPSGFARRDDKIEKRGSPIPGETSTEHFRSYAGPTGQGIYLFHWDGFPGPDRGPMVAVETWPATVGGEAATISRTSMFFGTKQEVLVAHFKGPAPRRQQYLIYAKGLDRPAFAALIAGARWRP